MQTRVDARQPDGAPGGGIWEPGSRQPGAWLGRGFACAGAPPDGISRAPQLRAQGANTAPEAVGGPRLSTRAQ